MSGKLAAFAAGFALAVAANLFAQYLSNNVTAVRRAIS